MRESIFLFLGVPAILSFPRIISNRLWLYQILQVKGLDGIFIGPMDLASSMGYFGDPSQAEVQAAIQTVEKKVRAAGKILATTTGTWDQAQKLFERGYQMLMLMADGGALASLATQKVKQFREQYPNG